MVDSIAAASWRLSRQRTDHRVAEPAQSLRALCCEELVEALDDSSVGRTASAEFTGMFLRVRIGEPAAAYPDRPASSSTTSSGVRTARLSPTWREA
jgi:hypothetical protein